MAVCLSAGRVRAFSSLWELVVLTPPNREYNVMRENVGAGRFPHPDHRFEWTRAEVRDWAEGIAGRFGYAVRFQPIGPANEAVGAPTQMACLDEPMATRG